LLTEFGIIISPPLRGLCLCSSDFNRRVL